MREKIGWRPWLCYPGCGPPSSKTSTDEGTVPGFSTSNSLGWTWISSSMFIPQIAVFLKCWLVQSATFQQDQQQQSAHWPFNGRDWNRISIDSLLHQHGDSHMMRISRFVKIRYRQYDVYFRMDMVRYGFHTLHDSPIISHTRIPGYCYCTSITMHCQHLGFFMSTLFLPYLTLIKPQSFTFSEQLLQRHGGGKQAATAPEEGQHKPGPNPSRSRDVWRGCPEVIHQRSLVICHFTLWEQGKVRQYVDTLGVRLRRMHKYVGLVSNFLETSGMHPHDSRSSATFCSIFPCIKHDSDTPGFQIISCNHKS